MGHARSVLAILVSLACVAVASQDQAPLLGIQAVAAAPTLLRDPYLTDVTGSWAMVSLATDTASPAPVVTWGPASGDCSAPPSSVNATFVTAFGTSGRQFKARLTGLQANTSYCYRVSQAGVDMLGSAPTFKSALAAGAADNFTFAVIGDWGAGTTDESKVISQIAAARPSFVVTTGDNVYNSGTQTEYGDLTGGNMFAPQYWPQIGRTTPAFAAEGNHGFSGSLPYFQNWPQDMTVAACAANGCRYQRDAYCCVGTLGTTTKQYPSAWYAFDWGNSRFYILQGAWGDTVGAYQGDFQAHFNGPVAGCAYCGAELTWLANDLASHTAAHKFAFWHYPLYSDSSSQPTDTYLTGSSNLEGLLARNGVHIVFNGHAHDYERNYPQIAGSPMLSYVTGGGGDPLGSVSRRSAFDAYARAVFHYLKVTVNGSSVTVTPIDENGATFDVQTYDFAPPPAGNDFSIGANPGALSVGQGQNATSTIATSLVSGSPEPVALSASGLPSGATASFAPSSVTVGGSSTMTIGTASSTGGGTYTIIVAGTSPSTSHTTSLTLSVTVANDFSVAVSPSSVSATQGQSATSTVSTVVLSGTPEVVTLSAAGLPGGATASFSPTSVTAGGSSTLTINTSTSTPAGTFTATVTGTAPSVVRSTSLSVTITLPASAPSLVQAVGANESAPSTTLTATFPSPTVAGHLLVLAASVYTGATNQISRVIDSAGNAWLKVGSYSVAGHYSDGELWYSANASSVTSVTVTLASAAVVAADVMEFAGVATASSFEVSSGASNTGSSADSGAVTPTSPASIAIGFVAGHGSTQGIVVTAPGYSQLSQQTSTNGTSTPTTLVAAYKVLDAAAVQDLTASFSTAMYWAAGIAVFSADG